MKPILAVVIIAVSLAFVPWATAANALLGTMPPTAVAGTVSGEVQQVGFRATISKQAIRFNLAGTTENKSDGSVVFVLQGKTAAIKEALAAISQGTPKAKVEKVATAPAKVDPQLNTFKVIDWTSAIRKITTKHTLVFTVRMLDSEVSEKDAEKEYHKVLKKTLGPGDSK